MARVWLTIRSTEGPAEALCTGYGRRADASRAVVPIIFGNGAILRAMYLASYSALVKTNLLSTEVC